MRWTDLARANQAADADVKVLVRNAPQRSLCRSYTSRKVRKPSLKQIEMKPTAHASFFSTEICDVDE